MWNFHVDRFLCYPCGIKELKGPILHFRILDCKCEWDVKSPYGTAPVPFSRNSIRIVLENSGSQSEIIRYIVVWFERGKQTVIFLFVSGVARGNLWCSNCVGESDFLMGKMDAFGEEFFCWKESRDSRMSLRPKRMRWSFYRSTLSKVWS